MSAVPEDSDPYWYDRSTLRGQMGECFVCGSPTDRVDIHFGGHYCGSEECQQKIVTDLLALNKRAESQHHCPHCGMTSHNPNDAAESYCGNCHHYCSDPVAEEGKAGHG